MKTRKPSLYARIKLKVRSLLGLSKVRAWFDLEPILAGRDVDFVDGHWKSRREKIREKIGRLSYEAGISGFAYLPYGGWNENKTMQKAEECFAPYLVEDGKFNLDKPNPDYWPIIEEVADICAEAGCEFQYVLFDHCQFMDSPPWACWLNNVQGRRSYLEDIPRSEKHVAAAADHLARRSNVGFRMINEGKEEKGAMAGAKAWYVAMFRVLKAKGVSPERIDAGAPLSLGKWDGTKWIRDLVLQDHVKACAKQVFGEAPGKKIILPAHNITEDPSPQFPHGPLWREFVDYFCNRLPGRLSNDGRKPDKDSKESLVLWRDMCAATVPLGQRFILEMLSDRLDLAGKIESALYMTAGIGASNLANYHRKPYVPETQPVEPTPAPVPVPEPTPKPKENWKGWFRNNRIWIYPVLALTALLVIRACVKAVLS